jgi:hypothetical protein
VSTLAAGFSWAIWSRHLTKAVATNGEMNFGGSDIGFWLLNRFSSTDWNEFRKNRAVPLRPCDCDKLIIMLN